MIKPPASSGLPGVKVIKDRTRPPSRGLFHRATGARPMPPIRLSDEQMSALLAASHPLPPASRSAFLEHCARELVYLPLVGDGALHRVVMQVQRQHFDPPDM